MKTIEIEDDLYKYILANIEAFGETPSQILRRLLSIPAVITNTEKNINITDQDIVSETELDQQSSKPAEKLKLKTSTYTTTNISLPEWLAHGVEALFAHEVFQNEAIITNKFKMLLTTLYYENTEAFVVAAKAARGRSRDYLGENLADLLASENKEELALFVASKPREIPYTPFWVVTNANTGRKRIILTQVMAAMGYPHHLIERIQSEI